MATYNDIGSGLLRSINFAYDHRITGKILTYAQEGNVGSIEIPSFYTTLEGGYPVAAPTIRQMGGGHNELEVSVIPMPGDHTEKIQVAFTYPGVRSASSRTIATGLTEEQAEQYQDDNQYDVSSFAGEYTVKQKFTRTIEFPTSGYATAIITWTYFLDNDFPADPPVPFRITSSDGGNYDFVGSFWSESWNRITTEPSIRPTSWVHNVVFEKYGGAIWRMGTIEIQNFFV